MTSAIPNDALDAEMLRRAQAMADAVYDGVNTHWRPDPPFEPFGREALSSVIEQLIARNLELATALAVAEPYASGVINDAGHPDQRIFRRALRHEGYTE